MLIVRILIILAMIIMSAGFIFFAANVIYLGTKEFFTKYGPLSKSTPKKKSRREKADEYYDNIKEKING